jgi:hypothetical protein
MVFETAQSGQIYAGMPFDTIKRPPVDKDLLPRELETGLAKVLLGQRELEEVRTFPFHDFVTVSDGSSSAVVFAQGIHAYQAEENGTIALTLRRSVEWLTASALEHRAGDAGPFMYVPDARCERAVTHKIAVMIGRTTPNDMTIHQLNAGFQNPPVIVNTHSPGQQTGWQVLQEDIPLSSLHIYNQKVLARFYNPAFQKQAFKKTYQKTDVWGSPNTAVKEIPPKAIVTVQMAETPPVGNNLPDQQFVTPLVWPEWRVGKNQGQPSLQIIAQLKTKIAKLETQLAQIEEAVKGADTDNRYRLQHMYYVLKRELYELRLSVLLNESKLAAPERLSEEYLYTPDQRIAGLGLKLNDLRIKRRIYDYVIEAL